MKTTEQKNRVRRRGAWGIATTEEQEEQEDPKRATRTKSREGWNMELGEREALRKAGNNSKFKSNGKAKDSE